MTFGNETEQDVDVTASIFQNLQFYYTPILVYLGSLGNCLSMCVFFGTKLRRSSSSVYLGALAISDTGFLISNFVAWMAMVNIRLFTLQGCCQFFVYLSTLCSFLSVWFVVAFTVERFVAVKYPLHRQSLCTVARAKVIVIGLTCVGTILCVPVLWFSAPRTVIREKGNTTECQLAAGYEVSAHVFNIIDTTMTFAVPFTIIVILNTLIAKAIYSLTRVRRTLTTESTAANDRHAGANSPRSGMVQMKITKMLLVVSTVFLLFNLPAYVIRVIAFLYMRNGGQTRNVVFAQQLCNLLFNTNFGINFVLYCATGQNFRRAIWHMFVRRTRRRSDTIARTSTHGNACASELTRTSGSTTRQRATVLTEPWDDYHELQVLSK